RTRKRHARINRKRQTHRMSGGGVGILPHDEHLDLLKGIGEGLEDVTARRQIAPALLNLSAQHIAESMNIVFDRGEGARPAGIEQFGQWLRRCHSPMLTPFHRRSLHVILVAKIIGWRDRRTPWLNEPNSSATPTVSAPLSGTS